MYGYTAGDETKTLRRMREGCGYALTSYDQLEKKIWVNRLNLGNFGCRFGHLSLLSERMLRVVAVVEVVLPLYSVQVVDDVCVGLRAIFFLCTFLILNS